MELAHSFSLNPAQSEVARYRVLESGFSCVLQMPTGSGKTFLVFELFRKLIAQGKRVIYVCPLKALADELGKRWKAELGEGVVGVFTGDYGSGGKDYIVPFSEARLLIMTPERLDLCTRNWRSHWDWIPELSVVAVDEFHILGDSGRGARLEGAIMRLRRLNPFVRFVCLSATLGNREELADWLEGVEFETTWRAIPVAWRIARYRKAQEKPSLLAEELAGARRDGGQSLVFVQSRKRAESLAHFLKENGLHSDHHHAGLPHSERSKVEARFRGSQTDVLVATGTLEMGLNLPVRRVFLFDLQGFDGSGFAPLSTNTVWQRAGRAGRPSLDPSGEVVLFAAQWDRDAEHYLKGRFEPIRSQLENPAALAEQVLVEVQSGLGRSEVQLERIFDGSLAVHQGKPISISGALREMLDAEMLRYDEKSEKEEGMERLQATPLGRIVTRHLLRPATVVRLRKFLVKVTNPTDFDLLLVAACTDDCEPVIAADFEELEELPNLLGTYRSVILAKSSDEWEGIVGKSGRRFLGAIKSVLVLLRWAEVGDVELVAKELNCYPFEIVRLQESMARLLMAVEGIQRLDEETAGDGSKVSKVAQTQLLQKRISLGLPADEASLTLVSGIGAKWARKLVAGGIKDLPTLGRQRASTIVRLGGIKEKRAKVWILDARKQAPAFAKSRTDESAAFIRTAPSGLSIDVDPYRLRRALELTAKRLDRDHWQVTGGLEPHRVCEKDGKLSCDCIDFSRGNTCKHVYAVRIARGERALSSVAESLRSATSKDYVDLFSLWFQR